MEFADFTLEVAESRLGLTTRPVVLFPASALTPVPVWLSDLLERGRHGAALVSEKAHSAFLIAPILLAARELNPSPLTIYSGQRLDVDAEPGLTGECDYILGRTPPAPRLRAPLVTVAAAKKGDVEAGLGQCVAEMAAARIFNHRAGLELDALHGCVTTGEAWQFLRLTGSDVLLDDRRRFIDDVGGILAVFRAILA